MVLVHPDAGCFPDGAVSFGCVVKDPTANIFHAASKRLESHADASTTEILATRWCLQVAKDLKIEKFIIQSDALVLVDCINDFDFCAALDPIVIDCKSLLGNFSDVTLMYVSHDSNVDAHFMVGVGKSLGFKTWIGHIPNLGVLPCNAAMAFS